MLLSPVWSAVCCTLMVCHKYCVPALQTEQQQCCLGDVVLLAVMKHGCIRVCTVVRSKSLTVSNELEPVLMSTHCGCAEEKMKQLRSSFRPSHKSRKHPAKHDIGNKKHIHAC